MPGLSHCFMGQVAIHSAYSAGGQTRCDTVCLCVNSVPAHIHVFTRCIHLSKNRKWSTRLVGPKPSTSSGIESDWCGLKFALMVSANTCSSQQFCCSCDADYMYNRFPLPFSPSSPAQGVVLDDSSFLPAEFAVLHGQLSTSWERIPQYLLTKWTPHTHTHTHTHTYCCFSVVVPWLCPPPSNSNITHAVILKPLMPGVYNVSWAQVTYTTISGDTLVCGACNGDHWLNNWIFNEKSWIEHSLLELSIWTTLHNLSLSLVPIHFRPASQAPLGTWKCGTTQNSHVDMRRAL